MPNMLIHVKKTFIIDIAGNNAYRCAQCYYMLIHVKKTLIIDIAENNTYRYAQYAEAYIENSNNLYSGRKTDVSIVLCLF